MAAPQARNQNGADRSLERKEAEKPKWVEQQMLESSRREGSFPPVRRFLFVTGFFLGVFSERVSFWLLL